MAPCDSDSSTTEASRSHSQRVYLSGIRLYDEPQSSVVRAVGDPLPEACKFTIQLSAFKLAFAIVRLFANFAVLTQLTQPNLVVGERSQF